MQNATHRLDAAGTFTLTSSGRVLSVTASQKRGRWQYRADGKLIASGIEPARFVAEFWHGTLDTSSNKG